MATDVRTSTDPVRILNDTPDSWVVESADGSSLGSYSSEGQAVAGAWDLIKGRPDAEILVQSPTGSIRLKVTAVSPDPSQATREALETDEERALYREAERSLPSRERIRALMARPAASTIDYSREDDDLPC